MTCKFPERKGTGGYQKGCRCERCKNYMAKRNATPEAKAKQAEYNAKRRVKHPLHVRHTNMMARCFNPKHDHFKNYGYRGITVSKELQHFATYEKYIMSLPGFDLGLQIDRIDNDGNYERGNLRWVTAKENNNNKKRRKS